MAIFKGTATVGVQPNKVFGYMDTKPRHVGFTLNSDTPYGGVLLDLKDGPLVVELPHLRTGAARFRRQLETGRF